MATGNIRRCHPVRDTELRSGEVLDEEYLERCSVIICARVVCKLSCLLHYPFHGWRRHVSKLTVRCDLEWHTGVVLVQGRHE